MKKWFKQIRWYKKDDGLLEAARSLSTVLTLVFGVWVFFHTVQPIFEKEQELSTTKIQLDELSYNISAKNKELKDLQLEVTNKGSELKDYEQKLTKNVDKNKELQSQIDLKEQRITDLNTSLKDANQSAIRAHVYRYMNQIAEEGIRRTAFPTYEKDKFDVQKYTVELVEKEIRNYQNDSNEASALEMIKKFATTRLSPESKFTDIFELITFEYSLNQKIK